MQTVPRRAGSSAGQRAWGRLRRVADESDDLPDDLPRDPTDGPAHPQEPVAAHEPDAPAARADVQVDPLAKRILLVEDDPATQDVYTRILVYGGFEVLVAENGRDAVRLARDELPDLILMDINLPILSGWEAAAILKGDGETRRIPIVAISANVADENQTQASNLGLEAYFTKPFPPMMVLEAVQRLFGMTEES